MEKLGKANGLISGTSKPKGYLRESGVLTTLMAWTASFPTCFSEAGEAGNKRSNQNEINNQK